MFFRGLGATWLLPDLGKLPESVPAGKEAMDSSILFFVWGSLADDFKYLADDKDTALDAWKAILNQFQKSNIGHRLQARQALYTISHDPSKPISHYINSVEKAVSVLRDLSVKIEDLELGDILLMNLHESYSTVRTTILTAKEEPDLATIKSILLSSSVSALTSAPTINVKQEADITQAANIARSGHRFKPTPSLPTPIPSAPLPPSRSQSHPVDSKGFRWCNPVNEGHCHRCGRAGHVARLCIFDMPQHIKDWVMRGPPLSPSSRSPSPVQDQQTSHLAYTHQDEEDYNEGFADNILGPLLC